MRRTKSDVGRETRKETCWRMEVRSESIEEARELNLEASVDFNLE